MAPIRKGRRAAGKRKMWKRKPRSRVVVNKSLQPISQRYICKMKWAADLTTDNSGRMSLNLNSVYKPDRGSNTRQPYGYDTLERLYNRYRVISCGWRVNTPNITSVIQVGSLPANGIVALPEGFSQLKESPRAKYVVQYPGGTMATLRGKTYLPSLFGRTKAQYMADDRYQAQVTTDPAEFGILNLLAADGAGNPITTGVILNIILEFTVEFFDQQPLARSTVAT